MYNDRVKRSAKQAAGAIKETVGTITGDVKLQADDEADQPAGKIQNAGGRIKDAMRDK